MLALKQTNLISCDRQTKAVCDSALPSESCL